MLGPGMHEHTTIMLLALSILRPKKLPGISHAIGRGIKNLKGTVKKRPDSPVSETLPDNDPDLGQARTNVTEPSLGGKERILFVDDDDTVVELNQLRLGRLGYDVVATTSSVDALEIFHKEPDGFDLVIIDYAMPDLTGTELAAEILKVRPAIPIILSSGYTGSISLEVITKMGIKAFVLKPPSKTGIAEAIRQVLDACVSGPKGPGKAI